MIKVTKVSPSKAGKNIDRVLDYSVRYSSNPSDDNLCETYLFIDEAGRLQLF